MAIFQPVQVFSKNIYVIDKNNKNNNMEMRHKWFAWFMCKNRNGTGLYHNHNIAVAVKRII